MATLPERVAGLPAALRPRLLTFELDVRRSRRVRIRWAMPLWAIEEILVFLVRAAPLASVALARFGPSASPRIRSALEAIAKPERQEDWLRVLRELTDDPRDLLAIPDGLPYVSIETDDVRIVIGRW